MAGAVRCSDGGVEISVWHFKLLFDVYVFTTCEAPSIRRKRPFTTYAMVLELCFTICSSCARTSPAAARRLTRYARSKNLSAVL